MITGTFVDKVVNTDFYIGDQTDLPVPAGSAVNVLYFTNNIISTSQLYK